MALTLHCDGLCYRHERTWGKDRTEPARTKSNRSRCSHAARATYISPAVPPAASADPIPTRVNAAKTQSFTSSPRPPQQANGQQQWCHALGWSTPLLRSELILAVSLVCVVTALPRELPAALEVQHATMASWVSVR